jgi:hypothetical protein
MTGCGHNKNEIGSADQNKFNIMNQNTLKNTHSPIISYSYDKGKKIHNIEPILPIHSNNK